MRQACHVAHPLVLQGTRSACKREADSASDATMPVNGSRPERSSVPNVGPSASTVPLINPSCGLTNTSRSNMSCACRNFAVHRELKSLLRTYLNGSCCLNKASNCIKVSIAIRTTSDRRDTGTVAISACRSGLCLVPGDPPDLAITSPLHG